MRATATETVLQVQSVAEKQELACAGLTLVELTVAVARPGTLTSLTATSVPQATPDTPTVHDVAALLPELQPNTAILALEAASASPMLEDIGVRDVSLTTRTTQPASRILEMVLSVLGGLGLPG